MYFLDKSLIGLLKNNNNESIETTGHWLASLYCEVSE